MPITINGTTGIAGVDGSASTPAVQGTDTNTGVFYPAADTVGVSTGGSERMRVDSSGNVGIGTSSPSYRLDVSGAATATPVTNGIIRILTTGSNPPTGYGGGLVFSQVDSSAVNRDYASITGSRVNSSANNQVDMVFSTGDPGGGSIPITERMRLTTAGNLLVGTTSNSLSTKVFVSGSIGAQQTYGPMFVSNENNTDNVGRSSFNFQRGGSTVGQITTTNSTCAYTSVSDYRLKENIAPMIGALGKVAQLKPCTFTWKSNSFIGQGFIAHELQEVIPDCVTGEKDAVNEDGSIKPQGIDTSFLVATLTAAIQEQQALIQQLQADVAALKGTS